ncbi:hypothetical protein CR513_35258, partial [Mucuna pruriens]
MAFTTRPNEPFRDYIVPFNAEARAADSLLPGVTLMLAKDRVKEGSLFYVSIAKSPLGSMEEFLKKEEKYINYENSMEARKAKQEADPPKSAH